MKLKKIKLCFLFLLSLGLTELQAQEAVLTAGGNDSCSGGSVSYSVGQIFYTTDAGTNGLVAQGVQQPYEISVVTSLEEVKDINLTVSVYPNPTTDFLDLKIENNDNANLSYQLIDMQGKLLETKKIKSSETIIVTRHLISTTYFLKITQKNKEVKIFKIIKN